MKKAIILTVAFAFVLAFSAPVLADMDKLKGGLEDIYTVPYDLGKTTYDEGVDGNYNPLAFFGGLLKGTFDGTKDVVSGAYDVLTFPFDGHLFE